MSCNTLVGGVNIATPSVGTLAYFTFKDPVAGYVKNSLGVDTKAVKLTVNSIVSIQAMIKSDLKDPFTEVYAKMGLDEVTYKQDLDNNIMIVTMGYTNQYNEIAYFRIPVSYIVSVSGVGDIEYLNKMLVIDCNYLPLNTEINVWIDELSDFIESRVGIRPSIKEVNIGNVINVDPVEHGFRETVRLNNRVVNKTAAVELEELRLKYTQLTTRLRDLNIVLGD